MISFLRDLLHGLRVVDLCAVLIETGAAERNAERLGLYLIRKGIHIANHADKRAAIDDMDDRARRGEKLRARLARKWDEKPWTWLERKRAAERSGNVLRLNRARAAGNSPSL